MKTMMLRNFLSVAVLLICLITSGCYKEDFPKKFTIGMERDFNIPAGLNIFDAHYFILNELPTNYQSIISQHNVPPGSTITLVPERAYIISTLGYVDFDFVDRAYIRIYTTEKPDDKPEAFYVEFIPNSVDDVLELIPTSFDALPFLKNGLIEAEVKFLFKETTPQFMNLRLRMDFRGNY